MYEAEYAQFFAKGYAVFDAGLDVQVIEKIACVAPSLEFEPIFGKIKEDFVGSGVALDNHRFQTKNTISTRSGFSVVFKRVQEIANAMKKEWIPRRMTVLKSTVGGKEQDIHRDYPSIETTLALRTKGIVQAGVIVSIMNGTKLVVYKESLGGPLDVSKRLEVSIPKGFILLFRGDLAHAGAAYDCTHYRVHVYLDVAKIGYTLNATEAVVIKQEICQHCSKCFETKTKMWNHVRACGMNPLREGKADKRQKNDHKGGNCIHCNRSFNPKSAMYKHLRKKHQNEKVCEV